jgi:eukaryotic-like serine/threonine-protein kinase
MINPVPGITPVQPRRVRTWSFVRVLILGMIAAFVLAVLLVNFVLLPWHVSMGREAVVPEVAGMSQEDAVRLLKSRGFATGDVRYVADTLVPTGQVVESRPRAGSTVKIGRVVGLDISSGKEKTQVPQVARLPANRAKAAIENAGLRVGEVIIVNSSRIPDGQVVSTNPSAGLQVTKGTAVNLFVSKGAEGAAEMPRLKGQPIERVRDILLNLELVLAPPTEVASSQPTGIVLSQDPTEGAEVHSGDSVRVTISRQSGAEKPADKGKKPAPGKAVKKPADKSKKTETPKPTPKPPKPTGKTK